MKNNNKALSVITNYCKYLLVVILLTVFFTSCSRQTQTGTPITTQDDIAPTNTVDEALAIADSQENYTYLWRAEDIDATVADYLEIYEQDKADGLDVPPQDYIDNHIKQLRQALEDEYKIEANITAQEAANVVGAVCENIFGFGKTEINYVEVNLNKTHTGRPFWTAFGINGSMHEHYILTHINIDATTGLILNIYPSGISQPGQSLQLTNKEVTGELSPAFEVTDIDQYGFVIGTWNPNHEQFEAEMDKAEAQIETVLTDSALIQGSAITSVSYNLIRNEYVPEDPKLYLTFDIALDDGRIIVAQRELTIEGYLDYDLGKFPMRAYTFVINGGTDAL